MSLADLESRVKVLEDIEAIRVLKAQYAYFTDLREKEKFGNLFADDAVMDFGAWGIHEGRDACVRFVFEDILGTYSFMMHMNHNPIIKVDGDQATGEWYFEVPVTHEAENKALTITGKYDEKYVRVGNEWKFQEVKGTVIYYTPYEDGWVKTPMYGAEAE